MQDLDGPAAYYYFFAQVRCLFAGQQVCQEQIQAPAKGRWRGGGRHEGLEQIW